MKRKRFVNLLLAVACVVMTGVTLHQYSVPIVPAADAQGGDGQQNPEFVPGMSAMTPASPTVRQAATGAIHAQLQAFAKDDYQTAIKYQSHNLRRIFPSIPQFRQMITRAYPTFAHYKSVKFDDVETNPGGEHAVVKVTLTGRDGRVIEALYMMVRESGAYKIDGVSGVSRSPRHFAPGTAIDA